MTEPISKERILTHNLGGILGLVHKTVVITGGARGIGKAMAERFARVGSIVKILDINDEDGQKTVKQIAMEAGNAAYHHCDITDYMQFQEILQNIHSEGDGIYVMIHNAGIPQKPSTIEEIEKESIDRIVAVNLLAPIYGSKIITPLMLRNGGGVQIFVSSTVATIGMEQRALYVATKHGIVGFLKSMGIDYGQKNIRFVGLAPGRVNTPFVRDMLAGIRDEDERANTFIELGTTAGVFRRMIEPEEVADMALLAASVFYRAVTGETIEIGGFSNGMNLLDLVRTYKPSISGK